MEGLRQRDPRQHDSAYMGKIAQLPCYACLVSGRVKYGVHVAHVRMMDRSAGWREVGKGERPHDIRTVPLCPHHHLDGKLAQHRIGEAAFWNDLQTRPADLCLGLRRAFENGRQMFPVLVRFAQQARILRARGVR